MNEIFERTSVREYAQKEVPQEDITQLLRAAMQAPSAMNQHPWEFIVVKDKKMIHEIPNFHPHAKMLFQADCIIVICGNRKRQLENMLPCNYWVQDCSAATQNLLLEAVSLGIGAVWLGVYPREDRIQNIKKLLNLPEHVIPLNIVSLGYPLHPKKREDTYNPDYVHWDKW